MGLFTNRNERDLVAAMTELEQFIDSHFEDWDRTLKLTIGARRACEFPVDRIESVIRWAWVQSYARGIVFGNLAEDKYREISIQYPKFSSYLPDADFKRSVKIQKAKFPGLVSNLLYEIGQIKPDYLEVLAKHLEEPEFSKIQEEAGSAVKKKFAN
jgi:hypothetical protein